MWALALGQLVSEFLGQYYTFLKKNGTRIKKNVGSYTALKGVLLARWNA